MSNAKNIIVEREGSNRIIWLSSDFVQQRTEFSNEYLYKITSLSKQDSWRSKKIEGTWYFDYDTIPNRSPNFYKDQFPLAELIGIKPKEQATEILSEKLKGKVAEQLDHTLVSFYMAKGVESNEALQLAESKAWLDLLLLLTKAGQHILFGFDKIGHVFDTAAKVLGEKKLKGLKTSNPQALRNKVNSYAATPVESRAQSLLHGLTDNQNAAIIGKQKIYHIETGEEMYFDTHLAIIYSLYLNVGAGNKQFKKTIHEEYAHEMTSLGMEAVSYQTLCKRTHQFNMRALFSKERDGGKYFNDNYMPYVAAERLQLSNTMWCGDGSSTKLLYRTTNGRARALMCYRIADVASRKVLGWCIYEGGDGRKGESAEIILKALEMAYTNAGVFACELVTDNGGGHSESELKNKLKLLFKKHTTITPGNSQENYAETVVKSMNNFGRKYENWGGSSWDAKEQTSKANFDNIDVSTLPNYEQAYFQAEEWIKGWNAEIRADEQSNDSRYELNKNQKAQPISEQVYRFVFGNKTTRDLSYSRGFVDVICEGEKLQYTIPNYETVIDILARKTGYKGTVDVNLYFDESTCDIYSLENSFIISCAATEKSHKSEFEEFEGSWKNHGDLKQRKEKMSERATEITQAVSESRIAYELLTKQQSVVKDDWEEINTAAIPVNETQHTVAVVEVKQAKKETIEERAKREAFFGN